MFGHGKNTTTLPAINELTMKLIENVGLNKVILTWAVMDHGRWGICLLIIPPCYHNNDIFSIFPHIMISESTLGELTSAQILELDISCNIFREINTALESTILTFFHNLYSHIIIYWHICSLVITHILAYFQLFWFTLNSVILNYELCFFY